MFLKSRLKNLRYSQPFFYRGFWLLILFYAGTAYGTFRCGAPLNDAIITGSFAIGWLFTARIVLFYKYAVNNARILYLRAFKEGKQSQIEKDVTDSLWWTGGVIALMCPPHNSEMIDLEKAGDYKNDQHYLYRTINDSDWQQTITDILRQSKAVIVEIDQITDNLAWELEEAIYIKGSQSILLISSKKSFSTAQEVAEIMKQHPNYSEPPKLLCARPYDFLFSLKLFTRIRKIYKSGGTSVVNFSYRLAVYVFLILLRTFFFFLGKLMLGFMTAQYIFPQVWNWLTGK